MFRVITLMFICDYGAVYGPHIPWRPKAQTPPPDPPRAPQGGPGGYMGGAGPPRGIWGAVFGPTWARGERGNPKFAVSRLLGPAVGRKSVFFWY